MLSGLSTILIKQRKSISTGLDAISFFIISAILKIWEVMEIEEFLTHLAVNENVTASTQNPTLHAVN